jgi:hypothetical protein
MLKPRMSKSCSTPPYTRPTLPAKTIGGRFEHLVGYSNALFLLIAPECSQLPTFQENFQIISHGIVLRFATRRSLTIKDIVNKA